MSYAKRWCFTLNNYSDDDIKRVKEICTTDTCVFAIVGLEVGQSGNQHMQGFIHFRVKKTFVAVKKLFPNAHIELAQGTDNQNLKYCSKENNILLNIGHPAENKSSHHSLLDAYSMVNLIVEGANLFDLLDSEERYQIAYGKHYKFIDSLVNRRIKNYLEKKFVEHYNKKNIVFYAWQQQLYEELLIEPHPRKIIWYIDRTGGMGKSTFAAVFICRVSSAVRYGFVKPSDMALSYKGERVVFFDLARANYDWLPMCALMEEIKNGEVFSGKYESCTKRFDPPHVVFFSNFPPPMIAFSDDRLDIRILNIKDKVFVNSIEK